MGRGGGGEGRGCGKVGRWEREGMQYMNDRREKKEQGLLGKK